MKCNEKFHDGSICGYEGIPTFDMKDQRWKCPACLKERPLPLQHDAMAPEEDGRVVCSQCGMHGRAPEDLFTECPGKGAHWSMGIAWCPCGEFGPAPKKHGETLSCKRCKAQYPPPPGPPQPGKRDHAIAIANMAARIAELEAALAKKE